MNKDNKIEALLQQARNTVPQQKEEGAFGRILDKLEQGRMAPDVTYRQLRNTALSLLLLLAVNIAVWSFNGQHKANEQPTIAQETYLQSYNLNLY